MSNLPYNNIPPTTNNTNATVKAFDAYYSAPLELDANTYTAMKSFFTSRGFESVAADNIAVLIIKQAKIDGFNPMKILDTMRNLDSVEISGLVNEIINYNRFKTSFLGYALAFTSNQTVTRNIESADWALDYNDLTLLTEEGQPITNEKYVSLEGE